MDSEERPYISEFIKLIMPDASEREQLDSQRDLDGFLEIVHQIAARIVREESAARDKTAEHGMSTSITSPQGETQNASP